MEISKQRFMEAVAMKKLEIWNREREGREMILNKNQTKVMKI